MRKLILLSILITVGCAVNRKAYVLRIGGEDPTVVQLCEPTVTTLAGKTSISESCDVYKNQELAGTMAVSVSKIDASATYSLEKERQIIAGVGDPSAFFTLVFQRAFALSGDVTAKLESKLRDRLGEKDEEVDQATGVVKQRLTAWLGQRDALGQGLAKALEGQAVAAPTEPGTLFARHINPASDTLITAEGAGVRIGFGVNQGAPPPARTQAWDAARELAYLDRTDGKVAIKHTSVVTHLETYCKPASFGPAATEAFGQRLTGGQSWQAYLPTHPVDTLKLARALGFDDLAHLRAVIKGTEAAELDRRLGDALFSDAPSEDQRQLVIAHQMATMRDYLDTCRHNIGVVRTAYAADAALVARLDALTLAIDAFVVHVRSAGDVFEKHLAPFLVTAVIDVITGTVAGDSVAFGPFNIEGDKTKLTIKRKDTTGERDIASVVVHGDQSVLGFGFSIGFGLAFSACNGCTTVLAEKVDTTITPNIRVITENRRSTLLEPIVTGHFDMVSLPDLSLGLVLGVPLVDVAGRSDAVMLGIGARLRNRVHIAAGIEAFSTRDLPETADGKEEEVRLDDASEQALTSDQVSRLRTQYAFVLAITLAQDVF